MGESWKFRKTSMNRNQSEIKQNTHGCNLRINKCRLYKQFML